VVSTATVSGRGTSLVDGSARGGDFYVATRGDISLAIRGDLHMATREDFFMATDSPTRVERPENASGADRERLALGPDRSPTASLT
jgi:hypothetical protein